MSIVFVFRTILNVIVMVRVRIRVRIKTLNLILILTADVLPLVTF